MIILNKLL